MTIAVLCGLTLSLAAQEASAGDKAMKEIEATYAAAERPGDLRTNEPFMRQLREVIARADESSLYVMNKYSTFVYMNGMKGDVEKSLGRMPKTLKESEAGLEAQGFYYSMRKLEPGAQVPDFTMSTPDGKEVNLYAFLKGKKCVILDFWASWCGWCRKESPNVQRAYDLYKGADFDVISVSFDDKRDRWLRAIEEDKTTWTQVSDLKGTKSPVYAWYDLNGIPAIFLLDGEGHVLEMGMRGEAIVKNVEKALGKR